MTCRPTCSERWRAKPKSERDRRAKVIHAQGEFEAAAQLTAAATDDGRQSDRLAASVPADALGDLGRAFLDRGHPGSDRYALCFPATEPTGSRRGNGVGRLSGPKADGRGEALGGAEVDGESSRPDRGADSAGGAQTCWTGELDYQLPEELIAQQPAGERAESRLMVVDRRRQSIEHRCFADIGDHLAAGSLLVANDSRVFRARLLGRKTTGGRIELLLLEAPDAGSALAMFRSSKAVRIGQRFVFAEGVQAEVLDLPEPGRCRVEFSRVADSADSGAQAQALAPAAAALLVGQVPLPPYIARGSGPDARDTERYQTVYADRPGSVAAPTAGLHFSRALIEQLAAARCPMRTLTLDVGPGTFQPVREDLESHRMQAENYEIPPDLVDEIAVVRGRGGPIVAVGTTSVRALESAATTGELVSGRASTSLFIRPGFRFRVVDALITNFHLPGSTLLALVMALAGPDLTRRAYDVRRGRALPFLQLR